MEVFVSPDHTEHQCTQNVMRGEGDGEKIHARLSRLFYLLVAKKKTTTTGILFHIRGVACAASELNTGIVRLLNGTTFRECCPDDVLHFERRFSRRIFTFLSAGRNSAEI